MMREYTVTVEIYHDAYDEESAKNEVEELLRGNFGPSINILGAELTEGQEEFISDDEEDKPEEDV
jgi:hypothetical protein